MEENRRYTIVIHGGEITHVTESGDPDLSADPLTGPEDIADALARLNATPIAGGPPQPARGRHRRERAT